MALNLETMFFCHGAPGSPQDANLLRTVGNDTQIIAPNMFDLGSGDVVEQMIDAFDRSTSNNDDKPVHVVGFSVGAMVAIKVAAARPDRIGKLTLISAAAPLQLGDFLLDMAGKPVFDLAKDRPRILRLLTSAQSILSTVAPNLLMNQLFGKCGKMEHALLADSRLEAERTQVTRRLNGLYDAIADGLRTAGLKVKLEDMEARLAEIDVKLEGSATSPIRLHPKLSEIYRRKVEALSDTLADPDIRQTALETIRSLISSVTIHEGDDGIRIDLEGAITALVGLAQPGTEAILSGGSVKVVAGVGFEPTTFRL
jgi:pimeloyl-ACP methyl ester carboxylesterase